MSNNNQSEVARLLKQIELEYQAANHALYGPSEGSARHDFINARYQAIDASYVGLIPLVGEEQAIELVYVLTEKICR